MVADWGPPVRLGAPLGTPCPEDAAEISRDGRFLYFYFTRGILAELPPAEIFHPCHGTYRAERSGDHFATPAFFDLGKGVDQSLDGAPSFSPDGRTVYFHSTRLLNTGWQQNPPVDDYLDLYVAELTGGEPGPAHNLGPSVNSVHPDGEPAIHPDGVSLYFTSSRPGGLGGDDLWVTTRQGADWSAPINLGPPVNTAGNELQPAFTADGDTMYFTSDRESALGSAIFRSHRAGSAWSEAEPVMRGIVGEPSLTADGHRLYFVHVLTDSAGIFDADVWVASR
jgi:Tol biopolymer transport system component